MSRDRISRKMLLVALTALLPIAAFAQSEDVPAKLPTDQKVKTQNTSAVTGGQPSDVVQSHTDKKTEPEIGNIYLTLAEAKSTFPGFKIEVQGAAPGAKAFIRGKIFNSCKALGNGFEIRKYEDTDGVLGFVIKDPGGLNNVRHCQVYEKQHSSCQLEGECSELPQPDGAAWALPDKSAEIGVVYQDIENYEWHLDPVEGAHITSSADVRAAQQEKADQLHEQRVKRAREIYDGCHNIAAGLNDSRDAIEELLNLGAISGSEASAMRDEVAKNELKILSNKAKSCKDDTDDLRDQLTRFAAKHPDSSDQIAGDIYPAMVKCVLSDEDGKELSLEDFRKAKEMLSEAKDLDTSSSVTKRLKKYEGELKMGRTRWLAQQGTAAYPEYMAARMQLQQDLAKGMRACSGNIRSMEAMAACQTARNDYYRIPMTIDADFNRAIQQEQQMQQQMWQMMNTPLGGGPGMGGQMGGTAGLSGGTPVGLNPLTGNQPQQLFGQQPQPQPYPQMPGYQGMPQSPQAPMWAGGAYGGNAIWH